MSEAGRTNSHRLSLNSGGTVSQNSQIDYYAGATLKDDERCAPCQARQMSIHENREMRELMHSESVRSSRIQIENDGTECRSDQINTCNNRLSENFATRVQAATPNNVRGRRLSSISTVKKKKRTSFSPICCGQAFSICLSLLAFGGFVYMYVNRSNIVQPVSTTAKPEQPTGQPHASALQEQVPSRVTGRFGLDQHAFKKSGKTEMRWSAIRLSGSPILTSKNDSCLIVPERGTYGVFSVLTFSINKEDNVTKLAHFMQLKGCQEDEMPFQRKLFAVPVPENRQVTEVIPSSLVSFVAMEANGRICIYTADKLQKYLYVSRLDNTVNIFKV